MEKLAVHGTGRRVVVVGGSIAGLTAAIALGEQGASVLVLERRRSMDDEGTSIALAPEAIAALGELGVAIEGRPLRGWRYAASIGGAVRTRIERTAPLVAYTYSALRTALLERARGVDIRTGARVVAVRTEDARAWVQLEDAELEADLVVAADGADSQAQRALFPGLSPEPLGITMWRGFVREEEARAIFGAEALESFMGKNTQLFSISPSTRGWWLGTLVPERMPGAGRRFGWVSYLRGEDEIDALLVDREGVKRRWGVPPGSVSQAARSRLRERLAACFPAPISALAEAGGVGLQRVAKLVVPRMARGRIALVGDAAHVVPPFTTAGATLAIGDATRLARAFADGATDAALARWSDERTDAARAVLARADSIVARTIDASPDLVHGTEEDLRAWALPLAAGRGASDVRVADDRLWDLVVENPP